MSGTTESTYAYSQKALVKGWAVVACILTMATLATSGDKPLGRAILNFAMFGVFAIPMAIYLLKRRNSYVQITEDAVIVNNGNTSQQIKWKEIKAIRGSYTGGGGITNCYVMEISDGSNIRLDSGLENYQDMVNEIRERASRPVNDQGT